MAAQAIQLGVQLVSSISSALLGQHSARLANATAENKAVPQAVQAMDADLSEINQAYKSGSADAATCVAALNKVDASIYAYLHSLVGKVGTAWSDTVGESGLCNKSCTAACCVYFGDLGPALSLSAVALGGAPIRYGKWSRGDPRISGNVVQVPTVYGSSYGGVNRPGYPVDWTPPAVVTSSPSSVIQSAVSSLLGTGTSGVSTNVGAATGVNSAVIAPVASSSLTTWLLIAALILGAIVAVKEL